MKQWPLVPLGELLIKSEEWKKLNPLDSYKQVTVKLWGQGIVERNVVSGEEIGSDSRMVVRANQFLISKIDARNGAAGLVPEALDGAVVSNDFPAFSVRPERIDSQFLGWYARTRRFVQDCSAASEGTTNRVRLKENSFYRIEIPVPPLDEQSRICRVLDSICAKISAATSLGVSIQNQFERLVIAIHRSAADGRIRSMSEILKLHEDRVAVQETGSYPQVGVRGFGRGLFQREVVQGSLATTYKHFNRLFEGCVVLSQVKGWEGAVAVCDSKLSGLFVSPEYRTFKCETGELIPEYFAVLVRNLWFLSKLADITRGVGARRERTRPEKFLEMRIEMPTVERQREIVAMLKDLQTASAMRSDLLNELKAVLPATVQNIFNPPNRGHSGTPKMAGT